MKFATPVFMRNNERQTALTKMSPAQFCMQMAADTAFNLGVVFGPREEDRWLLTDQGMTLCQHIHEGYLSGEWRPIRGSDSEYIVLLIEEIAGGKPRPDQRDEIHAKIVQRLAGILSKPKDVLGRVQESPFIPIASTDPKREAALNQLNAIGKLKLAD